jgi:hypothetical protein
MTLLVLILCGDVFPKLDVMIPTGKEVEVPTFLWYSVE